MTEEERETLAESLVPVAGALAAAVRDHDAERVHRILDAHGDHLAALAVVTASLVPKEERLRVLDIDEVAVRRVLEGDRSVRLNKAEENEAWRIWCRSDKSGSEFEAHTGIKAETVRKRVLRGAA